VLRQNPICPQFSHFTLPVRKTEENKKKGRGRKEGRKEGRKAGRKEGRKAGRKEENLQGKNDNRVTQEFEQISRGSS
jgi:hypothetical protein